MSDKSELPCLPRDRAVINHCGTPPCTMLEVVGGGGVGDIGADDMSVMTSRRLCVRMCIHDTLNSILYDTSICCWGGE